MNTPRISSPMDRARAFVARDPEYARTYCRRLRDEHARLFRARENYGEMILSCYLANDRAAWESWARMIQETDAECTAAFLSFDRLDSAIADHARKISR